MALLVNTQFRGLVINNAYVSVSLPSLSASKTEMYFTVSYRVDVDNDPFNSVLLSAPYDLNGENPFIQAYEYLKTLPEFEGYSDC